jgi:hypothetical protein
LDIELRNLRSCICLKKTIPKLLTGGEEGAAAGGVHTQTKTQTNCFGDFIIVGASDGTLKLKISATI